MGSSSRCGVNTAAGHALLSSPLYSSASLCGHQSCTEIHCIVHLANCAWCHSNRTLFYGVQHSCPDLLLRVLMLSSSISFLSTVHTSTVVHVLWLNWVRWAHGDLVAAGSANCVLISVSEFELFFCPCVSDACLYSSTHISYLHRFSYHNELCSRSFRLLHCKPQISLVSCCCTSLQDRIIELPKGGGNVVVIPHLLPTIQGPGGI